MCQAFDVFGGMFGGASEQPVRDVQMNSLPCSREPNGVFHIARAGDGRSTVTGDHGRSDIRAVRGHAMARRPDGQLKRGRISHPGYDYRQEAPGSTTTRIILAHRIVGVPSGTRPKRAWREAIVRTEHHLSAGVESFTRQMRVASVPAAHPYVARVSDAPEIEVLPDPPVPGAPAGAWWPPAVLHPAWIAAHQNDADLLHIHFGTESFPPGHLTSCIAAARGVGWPVVFTVHDLEHPQLTEPLAYDRQLDELVAGADELITLTVGAAREIRERWGKSAVVIPHPSMFPRSAAIPSILRSPAVRLGVFLNDLRPNVDGPGIAAALIDTVEWLRAAGMHTVAEVRMRRHVRDEDARDRVRALCGEAEHVSLIEHERLSDQELATALSRLDVCILPYRHGTHSGWLELCWDLGVPVAVPDIGHYRDQHPESVQLFDRGDVSSMTQAVQALLEDSTSTRSGSSDRVHLVARRRRVRATSDAESANRHASVYRRLLRERVS